MDHLFCGWGSNFILLSCPHILKGFSQFLFLNNQDCRTIRLALLNWSAKSFNNHFLGKCCPICQPLFDLTISQWVNLWSRPKPPVKCILNHFLTDANRESSLLPKKIKIFWGRKASFFFLNTKLTKIKNRLEGFQNVCMWFPKLIYFKLGLVRHYILDHANILWTFKILKEPSSINNPNWVVNLTSPGLKFFISLNSTNNIRSIQLA
jgi:hypothetical protein